MANWEERQVTGPPKLTQTGSRTPPPHGASSGLGDWLCGPALVEVLADQQPLLWFLNLVLHPSQSL